MPRWLVVCTGNTCRSPLLAALLRQKAAAAGLALTVDSAGTAAADGDSASAGTIRALARRGIILNDHRSRPLPADLSVYDRIWCMTSRHAAAVRALGVPPERLGVVAADQGGVPDPFGGDDGEYEACARVLESEAVRLLGGGR
jgi:protein-tyrosine-phosphatase